jgi:NAD(P)-dependent dehydrogenase (short-subunit alcohol dehydrogenase family)
MSRIFISGSSTGLGLMAGELLASQGHTVVLHARNANRADETRKALPKAENVVVGDLDTIAGAKDVAVQVNALGRFDAVIHNAAGWLSRRAARDVRWPAACLRHQYAFGLHSDGTDGEAKAARVSERMFELFVNPNNQGFRAAVALYPPCSAASARPTIPTLILVGEFDDWAGKRLRSDNCALGKRGTIRSASHLPRRLPFV